MQCHDGDITKIQQCSTTFSSRAWCSALVHTGPTPALLCREVSDQDPPLLSRTTKYWIQWSWLLKAQYNADKAISLW